MARPRYTNALCLVKKGDKAPRQYDVTVLEKFTSREEAEKAFQKALTALEEKDVKYLHTLPLDGSGNACLPPGELHSIKE